MSNLLGCRSILHIDVCLYACSERSSHALLQHGLRALVTIFMNRTSFGGIAGNRGGFTLRFRMPSHRRITVLALLVVAFFSGAILRAEPTGKTNEAGAKGKPTEFVRLHEDSKTKVAELQVALVRYKNADGVIVDLVGAVHIGETDYYDDLNVRFADYDAVLFEMVGGYDEMTNADMNGREQSPVSFLQNMLKSGLGLEFQLDGVEYGKDNFLHADMSAAEFAEEQQASGEGLMKLLRRASEEQTKMLEENPRAVPQLSMVGLLRILASPDSTTEFKYLFAKQLLAAESLVDALEEDGETVLVGGRNRVALERMREAIEAGSQKLAIFYGAVHLRGMEAELIEKDGFRRVSVEWLPAWRMERGKKKPAAAVRKKAPLEVAPTPVPVP